MKMEHFLSKNGGVGVFFSQLCQFTGWIRRDPSRQSLKMDAAMRGIRDPGVPQLMDALLSTCWFSEKARKLLPGISLKSIRSGYILTQELNNDQLEVHHQHR